MSDPYVYGRNEHYTLNHSSRAPEITRAEVEAATAEYLDQGGEITYLNPIDSTVSASTKVIPFSPTTGIVLGKEENSGKLKFSGVWYESAHGKR